MEAIILAGGKGTRLQSAVSDVPKPMADIGGVPFLKYQIEYLISKNVDRIILSVGYKFEKILSYFGDTYNETPIIYAIEEQALGTGGAIRFALSKALTDDVLIVNGDTYFEIDLERLLCVHKIRKSIFTIAITQVESSGRYGGIEVDTLGKVERFVPKELSGNLFINVGTYLINKKSFCESSPEGKFSLEDDYFPDMVKKGFIWTTSYLNHYFVDIGIPEDYFRAVSEIPFRKEKK